MAMSPDVSSNFALVLPTRARVCVCVCVVTQFLDTDGLMRKDITEELENVVLGPGTRDGNAPTRARMLVCVYSHMYTNYTHAHKMQAHAHIHAERTTDGACAQTVTSSTPF